MQRQGGADASHSNRAALHRSQMVAGLKLPQAYRDGLRSCYWPGRAQVADLPNHTACMFQKGDILCECIPE